MGPLSQKFALRVLLFSTFIVSICGLSYELLIGSLSTNLEGNPVLQYSLTIGFFMSALGIGSYLSRFITQRLIYQFIVIEIILGVLGGLSVPFLNLVYIHMYPVYSLMAILVLTLIGTLVGLEIPLITRILKEFGDLKETISNVLTIDYIGGLVASLIFPLLLYPFVGLIKTAFIIGFLNVLIGIVNLNIFSNELRQREKLPIWMVSIVGLSILLSGILFSSVLTSYYSKALYDVVIYDGRSRYQHIEIRQKRGNTMLFLDNHLQFASSHEYRYHEALIFPPFMLRKGIKKVLIMGGGDGLGVRQLLKFPSVEKIVLVDLDAKMTNLAKYFSLLRRVNHNAFDDPRVEVINQDAYKYLGTTAHRFDVIYADFPDPHDAVLSKLYSMEFYHFVKRRLTKEGIFITQATSPLHAKKMFWCVGKTLKEVFRHVTPYHINEPSMGDWGFFVASDPIDLTLQGIAKTLDSSMTMKSIPTEFLSKEVFLNSLVFPKDSKLKKNEDIQINRFTEPIIYQYYLESWKTQY
ncbi:MAG: polyamine aminopropyltransferase 1 [bacterium]|nr:MAG: polyamine aminopropyltransferase 1 [bacterium]